MLKTCKHLGPMGRAAGMLVIIGSLNWGLVGIGYFLDMELNVMSLSFAEKAPEVEAIIYILVSLSVIALLFGGSCRGCEGGNMRRDRGMGM